MTTRPNIRFRIVSDSGTHIRNCITRGEARKHAKRILLAYPLHTVLRIVDQNEQIVQTFVNE